MRIFELISEQTIGTTGSTSGPVSTVGAVSNQPSDKPAATTSPSQNSQDANLQKLAATLRQNKVIDNEKDINDFVSAYQAQTSGKTLNPTQQQSMSKLAGALLKNKNLSANLDLQLKLSGQQKPGQPAPVQTAPGGM